MTTHFEKQKRCNVSIYPMIICTFYSVRNSFTDKVSHYVICAFLHLVGLFLKVLGLKTWLLYFEIIKAIVRM